MQVAFINSFRSNFYSSQLCHASSHFLNLSWRRLMPWIAMKKVCLTLLKVDEKHSGNKDNQIIRSIKNILVNGCMFVYIIGKVKTKFG